MGDASEDSFERRADELGGRLADAVRSHAIADVPIGTFLMTPGASSETLAMFCGQVDSTGVGGLHGLDHEGEDIRCFTLPAEEALPLVMAAPCPNANTVIALQWLLLNRPELKRRWGRASAP